MATFRDRIRSIFARRRLGTERRSADVYRGIGWSDWHTNDGFWPEEFGAAQNLYVPAVWRCVSIITGALAGLDWRVVRKLGDGKTEQAHSHPLNMMLNEYINPEYPPANFWSSLIQWQLLTGNSYAEIVRSPDGQPREMYVIEPSRVQPARDKNGTLIYRISQAEGGTVEVAARNILHLRGGLSPCGVSGYSASEAGRETFRAAKIIERWANAYFSTMSPTGIITVTRDDPLTPLEMQTISQLYSKSMSGPESARTPFIAADGVDFKAVSHAPENAQMIETRMFLVHEICRIFGVPSQMVFARDGQLRADTEEMNREFSSQTLMPLGRMIEQEVNMKLVQRPMTYRATLDYRGLVRGDMATRATYYKELRLAGIITINEVRAMENLDPVDERGDVLTMQTQNAVIQEDGNPTQAQAGMAGESGESGMAGEEADEEQPPSRLNGKGNGATMSRETANE